MFQILKSNELLSFILCSILWGLVLYWIFLLNLSPFPWEFKYYLLGAKLNKGFQLYADIKDNTSPFSALFYRIISLSQFPISWNIFLSSMIIGIQTFIFQQTIQKHQLLPKIGLIPGIVYLLTFHLSFEFFVPTPALLGLTFLLLAWREITLQQTRINTNDKVFFIGVAIGIASIFYLSYTIFILWAILSLVFHTGITFRQVLLTFFGYLFVLILTAIVFLYNGTLSYMLQVFKNSAFTYQTPKLRDWQQIVIVFTPAILLGSVGLWRVIGSNKIRAHAQKVFQSNLIYLLVSILTLFTLPSLSRANLVFILPCLVLFGLNTFYFFKENWKKELTFLFIIFSTFFSLKIQLSTQNLDRLNPSKLELKNEKLMVLGPQIEEYQNNTMTGPFLNWELSTYLFEGINKFNNVITVSEIIEKDAPTYIYDPDGKFLLICNFLPQLKQKYVLLEPKLYKKVH
jgi:hypothetical protein